MDQPSSSSASVAICHRSRICGGTNDCVSRASDQCIRHQQLADIPLHFHEHHGENVQLGSDRTIAYRKRSFANSIVFSHRPLRQNEIFIVRIDRIESGWSGHMRIGLTTYDPSVTPASLPMYALPDLGMLADSWVFAITRQHRGRQPSTVVVPAPSIVVLPLLESFSENTIDVNCTEAEESLSPRLPTDVGSRVGIFYTIVDDQVRVHLIVNGEDQGPLARFDRSVLDFASLFAVVDVYGTTKQVRVVPLRRTVQPLQRLCKSKVLRSLEKISDVNTLPLPTPVMNYIKNDCHLYRA